MASTAIVGMGLRPGGLIEHRALGGDGDRLEARHLDRERLCGAALQRRVRPLHLRARARRAYPHVTDRLRSRVFHHTLDDLDAAVRVFLRIRVPDAQAPAAADLAPGPAR